MDSRNSRKKNNNNEADWSQAGPQMQGSYPGQQPYNNGYPQQPMMQQPMMQQPMMQQPMMQQPMAQPYPYAAPAPVAQKEGKSGTTAGLLGIFLGNIGIHDFYLGYTGLGVAHICITVGVIIMYVAAAIVLASGINEGFFGATVTEGAAAGSGLLVMLGGLLLAGNAIWGFVEAIMCFAKSGKYGRDVNGAPTK